MRGSRVVQADGELGCGVEVAGNFSFCTFPAWGYWRAPPPLAYVVLAITQCFGHPRQASTPVDYVPSSQDNFSFPSFTACP